MVGKTVEVLVRRAAIEVADIDAAIRSVKPDMLLVDANCWGAMSTRRPRIRFRGSSSALHPLPRQARITAVRTGSVAPHGMGRQGP